MVSKQYTANDLLSEIEETLTAAAGETRNRRIRALERLLKAPLTDEDRAVEVLCEVLSKLGTIQPETTLITKCLEKVLRSNRSGLGRLIRLVEERHGGAIHCGCRVLSSLKVKAEVLLGQVLAKELLQRDASDLLTEALVTALKQVKHPPAKRIVTVEIVRHLDSPDELLIRHAASILAEVGDKSVEPALVQVLSKLLDGYYGGHADPIRKDLCSYFVKFKSRVAVQELLRGVERRWDRSFAETVGAICDSHPEVQADLLKVAKRTSDVNVQLECLAGLASMQKTKPRVGEVVGIVKDDDLRFTSLRDYFKQVLLRNPRESKLILFEKIQSDDERWQDFALEALKEMGVPIAEVAKAVGINPILTIYNYFFEGRRDGVELKALWEAKLKLGAGVKGTTTRFEHLVRHLLSCLGFITLDVDASQKAGVDTVAFPPTWSYVLLIGSTTGVVGDNLEKIANTEREFRKALGKLAREIDIFSIVATSLSGETNPKDEEYARKHGIVILRQPDIDRLLEWVSTNRSYKKFLAHLERKTGKGRRQNLLEVLQQAAKSKRE